jgi:hypothetical protein
MAFDWVEGFDYYPDVESQGVGVRSTWTDQQGGATVLVAGRFAPGKALRLSPGGNPDYVMRGFTPGNTKALGMALKLDNLSGLPDGVGREIFAVLDSNGNTVFTVLVNLLGEIRLQVINGNVYHLGTARKMLTNTWHYVEVVLNHADAGRGRIWLDGQMIIDQNFDSQPVTASTLGRLRFHRFPFSTSYQIDDMYVIDGVDPLGECRIQLLEMASDAAVAWTPNPAGGGNYVNVDDTGMDSDATYNASNVVGAKDYFALTPITVDPTKIHAVSVVMASRKEDSGTRTIRTKIKSVDFEGNGHNENQVTNYTWCRDIFTTDPADGTAWTKARVNALQVGYELVL